MKDKDDFDRSLSALPAPPPSNVRKLMENWKRNWTEQEELEELEELLAKADFAKFKSYVKAGFTESQALDLLKANKVKVNL